MEKTDSNNNLKEREINFRDAQVRRESNYEICLIDDSTLKIKIVTKKSVNINCIVRDLLQNDETAELKSSNIFVSPKNDSDTQEIEIIVSIADKISYGLHNRIIKTEKGVLQPNPEVAHLIEKKKEQKPHIKTREEILDEKLGIKNPFRLSSIAYQKNISRAIIISIIFTFSLIVFLNSFANKANDNLSEEHSRMIVLQDINDPSKVNVQNVEDPKKPPEDELSKITTPDDIKKQVDISRSKNPIKTKPKEKPENKLDSNKLLADKRKIDSVYKADSIKKSLGNSNITENKSDTAIKNDSLYNFSSGEKSTYNSEALHIDFDAKSDWVRSSPPYMENELKTIVLTAKDGDIQLSITGGKSEKYNLFRDKILPENKFLMGDDKYEAYKIDLTFSDPKLPPNSKLFVYYIKFENNEFTCSATVADKFYDDEIKNYLDATIRSIRVVKSTSTIGK